MAEKSSNFNMLLAGASITIGLVFLFLYLSSDASIQSTNAKSSISAPKTNIVESNIPIPQIKLTKLPKADKIATEESEFEALKRDLIKKLRNEYGSVIKNIVIQVSLKDFLDGLLKAYPERGRALFESVIRGAFPELAEKILIAVATMVEYDQWLLDNILTLNDMNLLAQKGELWKKREELFGEDAKKIWSEELTAEEDRRVELQKTVSLLDQAYDTTMNERIFILQTAYNEQYDETVENAVLGSTGVLSQVLFSFDSVQRELKQLSNDERQVQIDSIRRTMGFDEITIAELSERDQHLEKRWQNGYNYKAERKEVATNLSGAEFDEALYELQVKYFKHEAPTIAREEMDDFWRFDRSRIYGRN